MKALLAAASLAALLFAGSAKAATALKVGQQVNGDLSVIGVNYVWTIKLKKGMDYAFEVINVGGGWSDWTVKDPAGKTLHNDQPGDGTVSSGVEFRAAVTGTYKVIGRATSKEFGGNGFRSMGFRKDCAPSKITTCYLNIGTTQNRYADYSGDEDWVLLKGMTVGNRYTVTIAQVSGESPTYFDVVQADGTVVAEGNPVTFTKVSTAPVYARHRHDDDVGEGLYSLTLKAAAQ